MTDYKTDDNGNRLPQEQAKRDAKIYAYATFLEETETAVEVRRNGTFHYVAGKDGVLYHALAGGEPQECSPEGFELLLSEQTYIIDGAEAFEFEPLFDGDSND